MVFNEKTKSHAAIEITYSNSIPSAVICRVATKVTLLKWSSDLGTVL
jgi:hypothetical protein